MTTTMTTTRGVALGVLAMAAVVAASNYLVQFPAATLFGVSLDAALGVPFSEYVTWGAFTFPVAFLVNDLCNRLFGASAARKVVFAGFVVGLAASWLLSDARIAMASGAAFLCGQLLDIQIFNRLRDGNWWKAPLVSSLIAGTVDSLIFWPGAFAGSDFIGWQQYAVVDWGFKVLVTLFMLAPYRGVMATRTA